MTVNATPMLRKAPTVLLLCQRCVGVSSYGGVVRIADMVAVMSSKLFETSGLKAKLKKVCMKLFKNGQY